MKKYMHEGIAYPDPITPTILTITRHYSAHTSLEVLEKMCADIPQIFVGDCMDVTAFKSILSEAGHDLPKLATDEEIAQAWQQILARLPADIREEARDRAEQERNVVSLDARRPFEFDDIPEQAPTHDTCHECGSMYRRDAFCLNATCVDHVPVADLMRGDIVLHERKRWTVEGVEFAGEFEKPHGVHLVDDEDRCRGFAFRAGKRVWRKKVK